LIAFSLEQPSPSEIAVEIFRRHTVEAAHPAFQTAVIGVHVLNVKDAPAMLAAAGHEPNVVDTFFCRERSVGIRAIADQDRILGPLSNLGWVVSHLDVLKRL
jgi:hypothetical protein